MIKDKQRNRETTVPHMCWSHLPHQSLTVCCHTNALQMSGNVIKKSGCDADLRFHRYYSLEIDKILRMVSFMIAVDRDVRQDRDHFNEAKINDE